MPRRSRMAVLAAASALTLLLPSAASRAGENDEPGVQSTVSLQLQITGLAEGESVVEIKPGHPGCAFAPVERQVRAGVGGGMHRLEPIRIEARSLGADRDCSFAITIREPGQPPRTFRRGVRLSPPSVAGVPSMQTVKLYLSAPSVATRDEPTTRR